LYLLLAAALGMTSCSKNGSSHSGAATTDGAKACGEYSAVSKKATGSLDPSKWEAAIQSGVQSADSTLRTASEKAQAAIKDHDLPALVAELQRIPKICSTLTKGS